VICRVRARGTGVRDLLRYLFGPGERGEHREPRLVGAWLLAAVGGVDALRSTADVSVGRLSRFLEQPVGAGISPPRRPVWHCSVHSHPADRVLSDDQWGSIAAEFVAAVGAAPFGDPGAARWVAVRHADDHVHIVATLVRQDGSTVWARNDFHRCQSLARQLERRFGLHQVGVTSGRAPT
jgi:hypothetical protein